MHVLILTLAARYLPLCLSSYYSFQTTYHLLRTTCYRIGCQPCLPRALCASRHCGERAPRSPPGGSAGECIPPLSLQESLPPPPPPRPDSQRFWEEDAETVMAARGAIARKALYEEALQDGSLTIRLVQRSVGTGLGRSSRALR